MRKLTTALALATLASVVALPVIAQDKSTGAPAIPGVKDASRVTAGSYALDASHSQVIWQANHFGFTDYQGIFGDVEGDLTLDPAAPEKAAVNITIPIPKLVTTSDRLTKHMLGTDFFSSSEFPTATFKSTNVDVTGETAKITGDLTIKGIPKSVALDAEFTGAGTNPFSKKFTVGFKASTTIKRSDFGVNYGIPVVSDEVELQIIAAFEKF